MATCTDDLIIDEGGNTLNNDKGIGELVLFSAGDNGTTTTRAVIPYMELNGRFVCKMFYHAKATDTDAEPFDTISTPITSWLRVNDNEGNSVYWQKDYDMAGVDETHRDFIDYGFDSRAQYFYWRNRLDHVFLGFTDYNKLKTNTYGTTQGKLFMYPEYDGAKKTKIDEIEAWIPSSYKRLTFTNTDDVFQFAGVASLAEHPGNHGVHFPLSGEYDCAIDNYTTIREKTKSKVIDLINSSSTYTLEEKAALVTEINRPERYSDRETTAEGIFHNDRWWITYNPDETGVIVDNTVNLEKAIVYQVREKQEIEDVIATAPANTFDLRRGTSMTKMSDQPDPLIAITKMKPTGATQEANRVRLYFKHQFSQIQVNLTKGENTAEIKPENIVSVELLGVTEKGYVFTNINPGPDINKLQIPPTYDPVVISKYTENQLKKNPYGTSFNMFKMADTDKPLTSITSFNAIAFGQLQAIRITWKENPTNETYNDETAQEENNKHLVENGGKKPGEDGYTPKYEDGYTLVTAGQEVPPVHHVATYKITVDDRGNSLVNLKSGFRYVYDFELRRGTIAFIRATIDGWLLDDELNFRTDGTINEQN